MKQFLLPLLVISFLAGCTNNSKTPEPDPVSQTPAINFAVTKTIPHDTNLYTEGFAFHNGKLFEGTGSPDNLPQTRSLIGSIDLNTGKFDQKIELDRSVYFGEGIVFLKDRLYQLTYQNGIGFIYDAGTFKRIDSFTYKNAEGWGLTTDGTSLIMSDKSDKFTFLDPVTLQPTRILNITENNNPLPEVNELEYINGFIYGNVWQTDNIVKIDPSTGNVVGKINLSSLTYEARHKNPLIDVLNGIAYDAISDKIYVTGKLWPVIYEINFPH
jgi:glutaminyl-peptide cyclotransferase